MGRRSRRSGLGGCAALTLAAAAAAVAGCGGSGAPASSPRLAPPPDARALVARLRALDVTSERYTQTTHVQAKGAHGRSRRYVYGLRGEVDARAGRGATVTTGASQTPIDVVVGPSLWSYSQSIGRCDGGRPWVLEGLAGGVLLVGGREVAAHPAPAVRAAFPYAGLPGEHSLGGSGPYRGLVNLLATARGPVRDLGAAAVRGRPVTEFEAVVDPARVVPRNAGLTPPRLQQDNEAGLIAQTAQRSAPTRLRLFVTPSGVPLRLVTRATFYRGAYTDEEETDVLAVNTPVSVKPPPSRSVVTRRRAVSEFFSCPAARRGRAIEG